MIRRMLLSAALLFLAGCTHLICDSTERLQLRNLSDVSVRDFSVVGKNDTLVWISETVAPGELSYVYERDFVGTFHVLLFAKSDSGWTPVDLGKIDFDGGSELANISKKDGRLRLKFE
jgi:hypothetical protein